MSHTDTQTHRRTHKDETVYSLSFGNGLWQYEKYERLLFLNGHHIIKHTNDHFMQPKVVENYFQTEKQGLSSDEG